MSVVSSSQNGEGNGGAGITTDSVNGIYVIERQVEATSTTVGVTYNMFANEMAPSASKTVKYDYVFDLSLNATEAASFCNAFDVSGADAMITSDNNAATVALTYPNDVKAILDSAFANALAEAGQTPITGVAVTATLSGSEKIDDTLTSIFRKWVNTYGAATFESDFLSEVVGQQTSVTGQDIDLAFDATTGATVSALRSSVASTAAVAAGGALQLDMQDLHRQLPASNLRLYENEAKELPNALLLKGGDTVVIGFSVTLDPLAGVTCSTAAFLPGASSPDPTGITAKSPLDPIALNSGDYPITRPVEIAIRLHMPGSGKLANVRAPGVAA